MFNYTNTFSGYSVDDLKQAKEFYGQVLGLPVDETPEGLVIKPLGGQQVFLYHKPNHEPATFTVLNFRVVDIDQAVDELVALGVKFEHYDFGDYKTDDRGILKGGSGPKGIAWFKDPAGNVLSVLQEE